jgi:2-desacetyl-2-hydroxyethyl bacteriochlorophyllide A dehydrogenase
VKSLVCPEPNRFEMQDAAEPQVKPGEVLVRVKACGVCGSDIHAFRGNQLFFTYPRVFGHELGAEVVEVGSDVKSGLEKGDAVAILPYMACGQCIACRKGRTNCCTNMQVLGVHVDGGMCEYLSLPEKYLIKTEGLDWDQLALVECMAIGAHAVNRAKPGKGEWALVIGAGPIGLGTMAFARLAGARVIAMDIDQKRLDIAKEHLGVEKTILAGDDAAQTISQLTDGEFVPYVYDATGHQGSMENALSYLSHAGYLVYIGHFKGSFSLVDAEFHKRETTLMGSRNAVKSDLEEVIAAMASGELDVAPLITHRAELAEMPSLVEDWLAPGSGMIKGVVEIEPSE